MNKIPPGVIVPSSALCLPKSAILGYGLLEKSPEPGDVVFGKVRRIGHHSSLENVSGRIHTIHNGTKALFDFGKIPGVYCITVFVEKIALNPHSCGIF